jgi:hypothetical protein
MQKEVWVMRIKWFFPLLVLLTFGINACRSTENRSAEVKSAEITCRPGSPSAGSAVADGTITFAWDPNKEPDLAGYQVYYGTAPGSYNNCVDIGNPSKSSSGAMEYTLTALEKGKKYYLALVAYDKTNNKSGFSSEVSGVAK